MEYWLEVDCGPVQLRGNVMAAGSRTSAISKMELFMTVVKDWKPLAIVTKSSILDVAGS